jgi:hypothetical protein
MLVTAKNILMMKFKEMEHEQNGCLKYIGVKNVGQYS